MVNGLEASEMVMVFKNGQMVLNTKVNGKIIEHMEKVNLSISTVTSMMENGLTTKQTAMESTITSMVPCMRGIGEMIFSMVKERNRGLMARSMKATTWPVKSMVWVFIAGTTAASIQVNGSKTKSKVSEPIAGWMEDNIKESGWIIIWMEWESILGLMVDAIWVNTKMTRSTATESTNGPMEDFILVSG